MNKLSIYLVVLCLLIVCVFLYSEQKCKLESMLLTENDFPVGTILNQTSSPIAEMPNESVGFTANYNGSAMYHEISHFPNTDNAIKEFEDAQKRASVQTDYIGPWETPNSLSYVSTFFQRYYVACGKVNEKYQCRMIGQYDEYYVFFFAYISGNGITFTVLNGLIQRIDDRMASCLGK